MIDIEIPGRDFDYKVTAKEATVKILKDIGGIDNFDERECVKCIAYMIHEISTYTGDLNITLIHEDHTRMAHYIPNYNKETDNVDMKSLHNLVLMTSDET